MTYEVLMDTGGKLGWILMSEHIKEWRAQKAFERLAKLVGDEGAKEVQLIRNNNDGSTTLLDSCVMETQQ
jgi:hypothetical protein